MGTSREARALVLSEWRRQQIGESWRGQSRRDEVAEWLTPGVETKGGRWERKIPSFPARAAGSGCHFLRMGAQEEMRLARKISPLLSGSAKFQGLRTFGAQSQHEVGPT